MASLPTRTTASFDAIKPVSSLVLLDNEFNQYVGATGFLNGGTTATKLLVKASDAADPPIEIDQIGAGPLAEWKQNGSLKASIENDGDLLANGITGAAGVYTFGSTPLGPASDPTTDNQLARKAYVDAKKISFTAPFLIPDPSTAGVGFAESGAYIIPAGGSHTITKIKAIYNTGSHTAGGSVSFQIFRLGVGSLGTITLDNTNNAADTIYTNDIGDVSVPENAIIVAIVSARSGTITERNVSVVAEGFKTVF
jgi:hypothetical protein